MDVHERLLYGCTPEPNSGCWLWTKSLCTGGYGQIRVDGALCSTHREAWKIWRGDIPQGLCILHRCDTRSCINPDHLFIGTHTDNARDMVAKGRYHYASARWEQQMWASTSGYHGQAGEEHYNARTTAAIVRAMRAEYAREAKKLGRKYRFKNEIFSILAAKYGLSRSHVVGIIRRRKWIHV